MPPSALIFEAKCDKMCSIKIKLDSTMSKDRREANRKKDFNYFLELTKKEWFKEKIVKMRKRFSLPLEDKELRRRYHSWDDVLVATKNIKPDAYTSEIHEICGEAAVNPNDYGQAVYIYTITGAKYELEGYFKENIRCCVIDDLKEKPFRIFSEAPDSHRDEAFPIVLQISPYANQGDIIAYVKDFYKAKIEPLQKKYQNSRNLIGKLKSKKMEIQERNDFIYEHRHLPIKEIYALGIELFSDFPDQGEIGKIISLEIQRRKKV